LKTAGLRAEPWFGPEKVGSKIRDASMEKIPYLLIVGEQEAQQGKVAVRTPRNAEKPDQGAMSLAEFINRAEQEIATRGSVTRRECARGITERRGGQPNVTGTHRLRRERISCIAYESLTTLIPRRFIGPAEHYRLAFPAQNQIFLLEFTRIPARHWHNPHRRHTETRRRALYSRFAMDRAAASTVVGYRYGPGLTFTPRRT
jgi:hypothetical protein